MQSSFPWLEKTQNINIILAVNSTFIAYSYQIWGVNNAIGTCNIYFVDFFTKHDLYYSICFYYRESYREILSADASVVDLHKLGPYYYGFGTHLLKFELPDTADVAKMLVKVL